MSLHITDDHAAAAAHDHAIGPGAGSLRSYLIGFGLAALLSAIPFWLVLTGGTGPAVATEMAIAALAVARILVHMVFFLRLNAWPEGGWTLMSLIFTVIVVVLVVIGSLWVMYHLDINTMPMPGVEVERGL